MCRRPCTQLRAGLFAALLGPFRRQVLRLFHEVVAPGAMDFGGQFQSIGLGNQMGERLAEQEGRFVGFPP